jgi:hypothetical protein
MMNIYYRNMIITLFNAYYNFFLSKAVLDENKQMKSVTDDNFYIGKYYWPNDIFNMTTITDPYYLLAVVPGIAQDIWYNKHINLT